MGARPQRPLRRVMAAPGEELVNPATGLRTVFRRTAGDTGGELLQVEWIGESRWTTGPDHVHRSQDERFETLAAFAQNGRTTRAGAPRNPLLGALILRHFEAEIYFVRPPLAVQRALLGPLAALARALGMRAERPYPYPPALLRGGGLTRNQTSNTRSN